MFLLKDVQEALKIPKKTKNHELHIFQKLFFRWWLGSCQCPIALHVTSRQSGNSLKIRPRTSNFSAPGWPATLTLQRPALARALSSSGQGVQSSHVSKACCEAQVYPLKPDDLVELTGHSETTGQTSSQQAGALAVA